MIVHLSDEAQQPGVKLFCTAEWGTPAWVTSINPKGPNTNISEVYVLDIESTEEDSEGRPVSIINKHYTFEIMKVTCPDCLKKYSGL